MLKRAATAVVLGPLVVWAVWRGPSWLVSALVFVVIILSLLEYFTIGRKLGAAGYQVWTIICTVLLIVAWTEPPATAREIWWTLYKGSPSAFMIVGFVFLLGCAAAAVISRQGPRESVTAVGISVAGFFLISAPLSSLLLIRGVDSEVGPKLVLFTLAIVWAGDILGYLVGKGIGKHAMVPVISPKKTWEGAVANFVGSVAVAWPFAKWMGVEVFIVVLVAGLANIAGQFGDLFESAFKRSADIKDSGNLLPGHGGMLDRVDALLFALPVVCSAFLFFGIFATSE